MISCFNRLLTFCFFASCFLPLMLVAPSGRVFLPLGSIALLLTAAFAIGLRKFTSALESVSAVQAAAIEKLPDRYVELAIAGSAALSIVLELAVIRWQSSTFEFFAFYKNFGLLSCFIGLGLGYALSNRNSIPLIFVVPALAWEFAFMTFVRFGLGSKAQEDLRALPFREQLAMQLPTGNFRQVVLLYALLSLVFLLTALIFLPIGQLCGRFMERRPKLRAYGLNLLGSLFGVSLMLGLSYFWTPPATWFIVCLAAICLFHLHSKQAIAFTLACSSFCIIVLVWPVNPLWNRVYSPYQLLEIGEDSETGLRLIRAAGHYYQHILNLGGPVNDRLARYRAYYDLPYRFKPQPDSVAVVGAGTGNDVAAALRAGARHVEAIEIDPAILMVGSEAHPEKPYSSPRVHATVNDARSFLRNTDQQFDLIVYGLLDSHTLLSQASSVRLDSFVYTIEGLKEARARLKPDGKLVLSFTVINGALARKIYTMLTEAFDGRPPRGIIAGYDESATFIQSNDSGSSPISLDATGFLDVTDRLAALQFQTDVSTDDWPFFYMPRRVYPVSYLLLIGQILVLTLLLTRNFVEQRPQFMHAPMFFLGAGFMLVETKAITEMGLTIGNTWQVIGIAIAGVLVMSFLGNWAVGAFNFRTPWLAYVLLIASLGAGWLISRSGGLASTTSGRLATILILTCPMIFSGIVFSLLLRGEGDVSVKMAANLLGATCGGLLEYNSMYFGFRALYVIAGACYLFALAFDLYAKFGASSQSLSTSIPHSSIPNYSPKAASRPRSIG